MNDLQPLAEADACNEKSVNTSSIIEGTNTNRVKEDEKDVRPDRVRDDQCQKMCTVYAS